MRLHIIRHADPDYANKTITPAGHREAKALADRLHAMGINRLFSSPLGRARHTAEYAERKLGITCEIEDWTRELHLGLIEQPSLGTCCVWDINGETVRANDRMLTHSDWHTQPPLDAPEVRRTFDEMKANSDAFIARLGYVREGGLYRVEKPNSNRVAVVCHGGFGLTWLAHLLEIPLPIMWAGFFLPPTSVTTVLFDERSERHAVPRCLGMGDVSHLYASGVPVSTSGIKANTY